MKIEDIMLACIKEQPGKHNEDCFMFELKNKQFISKRR